MNTTTRSSVPWSLATAVVTTGAAFAIGAWSLGAASGVTRSSANDYSTEFIDPDISALLFLLLVPVAVAAYLHLWGGLVAAVGLSAGYTWAMAVCVHRYATSGWGDGLEGLGYVGPVALGVMAFAAVGVTRLIARSGAARRRR